MRGWLLSCLAVVMLAAAGASAAHKDTHLLIFGDSLSDQGNLFASNGGTAPRKDVGYFKGRFTNAPGVWVDHLQYWYKKLGVTNFAFGAATACDFAGFNLSFPLTPNLNQQIDLYNQRLAKDTAFAKSLQNKRVTPVIFIGSNDLLFAPLVPPAAVPSLPVNAVKCILAGAAKLLAAGHKDMVVATATPIDLSPLAIKSNTSAQLRPTLKAMSQAIKEGVQALRKQFPGTKIVLWSTNRDIGNAIRDFRQLGFKFGTPSSCVETGPNYSSFRGTPAISVCKTPNEYLFWDDVHPTSRGHVVVARTFKDAARKGWLPLS